MFPCINKRIGVPIILSKELPFKNEEDELIHYLFGTTCRGESVIFASQEFIDEQIKKEFNEINDKHGGVPEES